MFELNQIRQFVKVCECRTLSKAADELFITQPALSRSMKNLEYELGVELFERDKNKILLNANGEKFYEDAASLLLHAEKIVSALQEFDKSHRTIAVGSCAPTPFLAGFTLRLKKSFPLSEVTTEIDSPENLIQKLRDKTCSVAIFPNPVDAEDIYCVPFMKERLYALVDCNMKDFASKKAIHFSDLQGQSLMLMPLKGHWNQLVTSKIRNAHFIEQKNVEDYTEIMRNTTLISFISDVVQPLSPSMGDKIMIPILDDEAELTYHLACRKSEKPMFAEVFSHIVAKPPKR